MPPKKKKELVRFHPLLQDNRIVWKVWALKLAESDKGFYYNKEKWLKDDKASQKPIETTVKSSFTSFLASGASFLGRKAAKRATNLRLVPRHKKNRRKDFFESLLWRDSSFKKNSRKLFVVDFSREVSNF